jgi:hypothetical protein
LVFENLSKAFVSPLGHVALLQLSEPARVQIKRRSGLIWHEKIKVSKFQGRKVSRF